MTLRRRGYLNERVKLRNEPGYDPEEGISAFLDALSSKAKGKITLTKSTFTTSLGRWDIWDKKKTGKYGSVFVREPGKVNLMFFMKGRRGKPPVKKDIPTKKAAQIISDWIGRVEPAGKIDRSWPGYKPGDVPY